MLFKKQSALGHEPFKECETKAIQIKTCNSTVAHRSLHNIAFEIRIAAAHAIHAAAYDSHNPACDAP